MNSLLLQSSTAQPLVFLLVLASDHITAATGLSPTVTISKNGGAFASPAGSVTEIANGWYAVAGNATDTGTLGPLILHASVATADPVDMLYEVVAFNPQTTSMGLVLAKTTNITGLNDIAATAVVSSGAITTSGGKVSGVILADTVTTYTGNTPQTGDNFTRIGAAGAGLTALGDTRIANLDATVSSRNATTPPTAAAIRTEMDSNSTKLANLDATISSRTKPSDTQAAVATVDGTVNADVQLWAGVAVEDGADGFPRVIVNTNSDKTGYSLTGDLTATMKASVAAAALDVTSAGHNIAGTIGYKINAAGSAADPLLNIVPGTYAVGSAGYNLGVMGTADSVLLVTDSPIPNVPAVIVPAPSNANQVVGFTTTFDQNGAAKVGVVLTFRLAGAPGNDSYDTEVFTATSGAAGALTANFRAGADYFGKRGTNGIEVPFTTPPTAPNGFALPSTLGTP